jgi:hypothetical protein
MNATLHRTAYNRAKTARAGAFAQLAGGGTIFRGRACSAFYAALTGIPEATCRATCAAGRLALSRKP